VFGTVEVTLTLVFFQHIRSCLNAFRNDVLNITYKITLYDVLNAASVICNRLNAELTFSLPSFPVTLCNKKKSYDGK
jgi:hypothetical protein